MNLDELKNNPDQVKQLIGLLSSLLTDNQEQSPKAEKSNARDNKFLDMSEFNMHKDDAELDKKLHVNARPVVRNRQFNYVDVQCRICGKKEQVSPGLVTSYDRYKCNRGLGTAG